MSSYKIIRSRQKLQKNQNQFASTVASASATSTHTTLNNPEVGLDKNQNKKMSILSSSSSSGSESVNLLTTQSILERMPTYELSYETVAHKKVFSDYDLCMGIATGKKYLAWFSFDHEKDVCYLMELNKEKQITKIHVVNTMFDRSLSVNTLLYGTVIDATRLNENTSETEEEVTNTTSHPNWAISGKRIFMVEDIYYYQGIPLIQCPFGEKMGYIQEMFSKYIQHEFTSEKSMIFTLPWMWSVLDFAYPEINEMTVLSQYEEIKNKIGYNVHHIQVRKFNSICPYYNIPVNNVLSKMNKKEKTNCSSQLASSIRMNTFISKYIPDPNKPQYKYPSVFRVRADVQYDVYHLFAYGKNREEVYYGVAYIPNLRISIFMNLLFRYIRENENLDLIEESDDEEDFENMAVDKYVDLNKVLNIECIYHSKFKKWVPLRVIENSVKIVHIGTLVKNYIY